MITENQILVELQKINAQLAKQKNSPFKNFLAGFMHSFGYFIGTVAVFALLAVYASRFNWPAMVSRSVETMMTQINWSKIVPTPVQVQP